MSVGVSPLLQQVAVMRSLVVLDLVAFISAALLQIENIIPSTAWAQYPIVAIGAVLVVFLMRHWTQNEDRWRLFVEEERTRFDQYLTEALQSQRCQYMKILQDKDAVQRDMLQAVSESQRAAYEEALERFLESHAWALKSQEKKN
jgi:hypothetical protein